MIPGLRQTARNISANWLHQILRSASSVILAGAATRVFDIADMGVILLATSIAAHLALLDIGASTSLARMLPKYLVTGDRNSAADIASTAVAAVLPLALFALLLSPVLAWVLAYHIEIAPGLQNEAFLAFLVPALLASVGLPFRIGIGLLATMSRMDVYFLVEIVGQVLRTLLGFAILYYSPTIFGYAAALTLPMLFTLVIEAVIALRLIRLPWVNPFRARRWALRDLMHMCGASILISMAAMMTTQSASLVVGFLGNTIDVALITFPLFLVGSAMAFATSFGIMLTPVTNALHSLRDTERMRSIVESSTRLATALGWAIGAVLLLASPVFLPLWLGQAAVAEGRLEIMSELVAILAAGSAIYAGATILQGSLLGTQNPWITGACEFGTAVLSLVAGALLYRYTSLGLYAIAVGIAAGQFLRGLIIYPLMISRTLGVNPVHYSFATNAAPFALTALAFALAQLAGSLSNLPAILRAAVQIGVFAILWVTATYNFLLRKSVKEKLRSALLSALGHAPG